MSKLELSMLLCVPVFLLVYSFSGIFSSGYAESFSEELNKQSSDVSKLKADWNAIYDKDKTYNPEAISFNNKVLSAVEDMYKHYSSFSSGLSTWVKRQSYTVIIFSLLNIYIVFTFYRKLNKKEINEQNL